MPTRGRRVNTDSRLAIGPGTGDAALVAAVDEWVQASVPPAWRRAAADGRQAIRAVRSRDEYAEWYPTFASSGLVVGTWPVAYGGLDLSPRQARLAEDRLAPYNLGRLNPLGLHNTAPALFAHGTAAAAPRFRGRTARAQCCAARGG